MVQGKAKAQWQHTASMLAMLANVNRDAKKNPDAFTPDDFNPYSKTTKTNAPIEITKDNVHLLRKHFTNETK